jgi:plasmid maintenance system antidote protein VapI
MIKLQNENLELACRSAGLLSNADLARAMGMNAAAVGRVRAGKRGVGQDFIFGLRRAFPHVDLLADLLVVVDEEPEAKVPA